MKFRYYTIQGKATKPDLVFSPLPLQIFSTTKMVAAGICAFEPHCCGCDAAKYCLHPMASIVPLEIKKTMNPGFAYAVALLPSSSMQIPLNLSFKPSSKIKTKKRKIHHLKKVKMPTISSPCSYKKCGERIGNGPGPSVDGLVSATGLATAGHPRMAWPSPLKPKLSE